MLQHLFSSRACIEQSDDMQVCWIFNIIPHDKPFNKEHYACLANRTSDQEVLLQLGDITARHVR